MPNDTVVRNGLKIQGNVDLLGNAITSSISNANISIVTNGSGKLIVNTPGNLNSIIETDSNEDLTLKATNAILVLSGTKIKADTGYVVTDPLSVATKEYVDNAVLTGGGGSTITVNNGGTGLTTIPANSLVYGVDSSTMGATPVATTGYLYFDGTNFAWQSPTGGSGGASVDESYITIGNTAGLTNERALAVSTDLALNDSGPGGSITLSLTDTTIVPGEYTKVTVDQKGRVTNGSSLVAGDLPTHNHDATDITTGTVAPARLGSGTPSSSNYLRGDGTWATPPSGGGSSITEYIIKVNFDASGVITTVDDVSLSGWTITTGTSPSAYVQINHGLTKMPVSVVCYGYSPTTSNFIQKVPTTSASTGFAFIGTSDMNTFTIYGFTTSNSGAGNSGYTLIKILMA